VQTTDPMIVGTEFVNKHMKEFLKTENLHLYHVYSKNKVPTISQLQADAIIILFFYHEGFTGGKCYKDYQAEIIPLLHASRQSTMGVSFAPIAKSAKFYVSSSNSYVTPVCHARKRGNGLVKHLFSYH